MNKPKLPIGYYLKKANDPQSIISYAKDSISWANFNDFINGTSNADHIPTGYYHQSAGCCDSNVIL